MLQALRNVRFKGKFPHIAPIQPWHNPYVDVSKNRVKNPKMDGENNGKPYFLMDDLGVPSFSETSILAYTATIT